MTLHPKSKIHRFNKFNSFNRQKSELLKYLQQPGVYLLVAKILLDVRLILKIIEEFKKEFLQTKLLSLKIFEMCMENFQKDGESKVVSKYLMNLNSNKFWSR